MNRLYACAAVCALVVGSAASAEAATSLFSGTGSTGGHSLSASVVFTTSANHLSILLSNSTPITYDAGELLTGIKFTINGVTLTPTFTAATTTGRNVDGTGYLTDLGTKDLKALNTWSVGVASGTYDLNFNPDARYSIIGPAEAVGGTRYAQANGSIDDNSGHNPFSALSATFDMNITGVTDGSNIGNVLFRFGTNFETSFGGTGNPPVGGPGPSPVPAPAAFWGGSSLLSALAGRGLLRRKKAVAL